MPEQTTEDRWKFGLVALVVGVVSLLNAVLVVGRLWPDPDWQRRGEVGQAAGRRRQRSCGSGGSAKIQALQANAALLARPDEAPAVLEQFRIQ